MEYCSTELPLNVAFAARRLGEAGDVQDQARGQQLLAELAGAVAAHAPRTRRELQAWPDIARAIGLAGSQVMSAREQQKNIIALRDPGARPVLEHAGQSAALAPSPSAQARPPA